MESLIIGGTMLVVFFAGVATGILLMRYKMRLTKPVPEEKTEEEEKIDRQWDELMKFDGGEV